MTSSIQSNYATPAFWESKLPEFWKDGLFHAIEPITKRYGLHPDQQGEIDAAVRTFLFGVVGYWAFPAYLLECINDSLYNEYPPISYDTAKKIAEDIKREVLMPIRDVLVTVHPMWDRWLV